MKMTLVIKKRKFFLKNKRRFSGFIVMFILLTVFMGMVVSAGASPPISNEYETIKVTKGDTLWEIALNHCPKKDIREYIYDIKKLNNLNDGYIYTGQIIILP